MSKKPDVESMPENQAQPEQEIQAIHMPHSATAKTDEAAPTTLPVVTFPELLIAYAPPEAKYAAQDKNGEWYYYTHMPVKGDHAWAPPSGDGLDDYVWAPFSTNGQQWQDSLVILTDDYRATVMSLFDSGLPGWAAWISQDRDGTWYCHSLEPMCQLSKGMWYERTKSRLTAPIEAFKNVLWNTTLRRIARPAKGATVTASKPAALDFDQVLWVYAPGWANWAAQDADGSWYYYQCKPEMAGSFWRNDGERHEDSPFHTGENAYWSLTLVTRPAQVVDIWDSAPEWAGCLAQNKDGSWEYFKDVPTVSNRLREWVQTETQMDFKQVRARAPVSHFTNAYWASTLFERPKIPATDAEGKEPAAAKEPRARVELRYWYVATNPDTGKQAAYSTELDDPVTAPYVGDLVRLTEPSTARWVVRERELSYEGNTQIIDVRLEPAYDLDTFREQAVRMAQQGKTDL